MIPTTLAFDQKRLDPGAIPVAAYILETAYGRRIWTQGVLPAAIHQSDGAYFDAEVAWDAEVFFDGGLHAIETLPRVVGWSPITLRSVPVGTDMLIALGEGERAGFSVTLANEDALLSRLLAEEYLIGRQAHLLVGYVGLGITDYPERFRGRATRWRLEGGRRLTIEHLEG